jgi:hypothetical protein
MALKTAISFRRIRRNWSTIWVMARTLAILDSSCTIENSSIGFSGFLFPCLCSLNFWPMLMSYELCWGFLLFLTFCSFVVMFLHFLDLPDGHLSDNTFKIQTVTSVITQSYVPEVLVYSFPGRVSRCGNWFLELIHLSVCECFGDLFQFMRLCSSVLSRCSICFYLLGWISGGF